jgi:hypothetical protein
MLFSFSGESLKLFSKHEITYCLKMRGFRISTIGYSAMAEVQRFIGKSTVDCYPLTKIWWMFVAWPTSPTRAIIRTVLLVLLLSMLSLCFLAFLHTLWICPLSIYDGFLLSSVITFSIAWVFPPLDISYLLTAYVVACLLRIKMGLRVDRHRRIKMSEYILLLLVINVVDIDFANL